MKTIQFENGSSISFIETAEQYQGMDKDFVWYIGKETPTLTEEQIDNMIKAVFEGNHE